LPVGRYPGWVTEGPLQLQPRHLGGGQAGGARGLKSGIRQVHTPAVPRGAPIRIRQAGIAGASVGHLLRVPLSCAAQRAATHELRNGALLRIAQVLRLRLHRPGHQRVIDLFRRHLANRGRRRCPLDSGVAMTDRAASLERGKPALGPRWSSTLSASLRRRLLSRHAQGAHPAADHDCQKGDSSSHVRAPSQPVSSPAKPANSSLEKRQADRIVRACT
jgi:hypothetical protein